MGGMSLLKLNNGEKPIVNKYREGKMKRTLKRESKVLEIARREAMKISNSSGKITRFALLIVGCSWLTLLLTMMWK